MYSLMVLGQLTLVDAIAQNRPVIKGSSVHWMGNTSNAYEVHRSDGLRTYYLKTDAPLRDNYPSSKEVKIDESFSLPYTRTKSPLFDSLFALSMLEVQKSSVSMISDHAFEDAQCECFETGEKWRYVWTRDTAYATDLGLAALDPVRSMNSLLFKVSGFRHNLGQGEQIVQDTGSGGSWPISTDRVVWSLGAQETLLHLPYQSQTYQSFLERSYRAMKNTVITDRFAVYDEVDGLYLGEQSFLDWREQSYPEWTGSKVVHIGMSKSLSTNVVHYLALVQLAEQAQELGDGDWPTTFRRWAQELKVSIHKNFWDGTSYRSLKNTFLDQRAFKYYDLLGVSLAILAGIPTQEEALSALNSYPHTEVGAPVIWPQRQEVAIYHNRAIWPFVTAYALKAAKKIGDPHLITSFVRSLIIGPAQNLSHMENFEFTTLRNYYADGRFSGPVVNSRRQLWSVAGYAGMVTDVIFGKEVKTNAIRFTPALTMANMWDLFPSGQEVELNNLKFQGKKIRVVLVLPNVQERLDDELDGLLSVGTVTFNGRQIDPRSWVSATQLESKQVNEFRISMVESKSLRKSRMVKVQIPRNHLQLTGRERQNYYAPRTPTLSPVGLSDNWPLLSFHSPDHDHVTYHVFKNGELLAKTNQTYYLDRGHPADLTACYSITAVYSSGNESFPSEPFCYWPISSIQHYPVNGPHVRTFGGTQIASSHGRVYLHEWGAPHQRFKLENVKPSRSGAFAIQVDYVNNQPINTGITGGVKKVTVTDTGTGEVVKSSVLMLPHHDGSWMDSSFIQVNLKQGSTYSVLIEDFMNMSYLSHFESYRNRGGRDGIYNMFNFAEIKLLYLGN